MNPADLTLSISPSLTTKSLAQSSAALAAGGAPKNGGRVAIPRVDLEPIYVQLKSALGDQWADYKAAINQFVLGHLNQAELTWVLQPLLSPAPSVLTSANPSLSPLSTLHLHNALIAAIYANTLRDPPPAEVAPWVVANDKPTSGSKNAGASGANDKAEERLKKEVMNMHARDRRRIKTLKETGRSVNDGFADIQAYHHDLAVKPPDVAAPAAAAGASGAAAASGSGSSITKSNWDLEIRRRYAQPLAGETLEFPTIEGLQNRIEPLCYEEGVVGGVASGALQACGELMEQATEVFLKELLGALCAHSRSNPPGGSSGAATAADGGIQTHRFRRQLRREEADAERGLLQRNPAGLLPVEMEVQAKRDPLSLDDLQLALNLRDPFLRQDRFLMESVALNRYPDLTRRSDAAANGHVNGVGGGLAGKPQQNGTLSAQERARLNGAANSGAMEGVEGPAATAANDSQEWSWQGGGTVEADELMGALDECLAVG